MAPKRAEEYRKLAQGCLALAKSVSTEEARLALMGMATRWLQLAEQQTDEAADIQVPPTTTQSVQPVAQQQQQVQSKDNDKKE